MMLRLTTVSLLLFVATFSFAQRPANIQVEKSDKTRESTALKMMCDNQFAGTIASITAVSAESNDIDLDTTFLCLGDQVFIDHNNDFNLFDDPTPSTLPGIGYGFFDCRPTVSGPNLTAIQNDPCINDDSPVLINGSLVFQTNGIWVSSDNRNGDITFTNDGGLIDYFGGGRPIQFWFAPITLDEFATQGFYQDPSTNEIGPCVNLNTDAAFSVVYLNAITASGQAIVPAGNKCDGRFVLSGGLPEFRNTSRYTIDISKVGRNSIKGTITSGPARHGGAVNFSVPEPGVYEITVEDGKSCGASFQMDLSGCNGMEIFAESGVVRPGDTVCVDVLVNNFVDVLSMQFTIEWDTSILDFYEVGLTSPPLPSLNPSLNFAYLPLFGVVTFSWDNVGQGSGVTLPDGAAIFQICFIAKGQLGDESPIHFTGNITEVQIKDSNGEDIGFDASNFGTIYISDQIILTDYEIDTTCFGQSNGGWIVSAIGGTPPYSLTYRNLSTGGPSQGPFQITNSGGTFGITNQSNAFFEITIMDNSVPAETIIDTIEVIQRPQLDVNIDPIQEISCFGASDGVLIANVFEDGIQVNNPGPGYQYTWSTGATTRVISNLSSRLYSITLTDQFGCQAFTNRRLDTPNPITITGSTSPATCTGTDDGALNISGILGGTSASGNYNIRINGPDGFAFNDTRNRANITAVRDGRYDITITDDNGCMVDTFLLIGAQKRLSVTVVVLDNVSCAGGNDGQIFVQGVTRPAPAATPYNFQWSSSPPVPLPQPPATATTSTINNLPARSYSLIMTDIDGCRFDTTFNITQPDSLRITLLNKRDETCSPGSDGTATVNVTGGTNIGGYTYNWGLPGQTTSTATGLVAGNYTLTVTDDNNCQETLDFSIGSANGPRVVLFDNDTLLCSNATDGVLTVVAAPGSAPIANYSWSNGASGPAQTSISNLAAGVYFLTITSQDDCETIDTAAVIAPAAITVLDTIIASPTCPGDNNGSIIIFPGGGTPPYDIRWSTSPASPGQQVLAGLTAGNYTVTISDANLCPPVIQTYTVVDPPRILVDLTVTDTVSCYQSTCDGAALANASYQGGIPGNFDFSWQSGETSTNSNSSTASQLCQGQQTVTVTDGTCAVVAVVNVPSQPPLNVRATSNPASCNGVADGTAGVTVSGGARPYSYSWNNGEVTPTITGLLADTYFVDIEDANGCVFSTSVIVTEPDLFEANADGFDTKDVDCYQGSDGVIDIVTSGGNPSTLIYTWQDNISTPGSNIATNLVAGTYSVTVTDARGCQAVVSHVVNQPPPITFSFDAIPPILCFGYTTSISLESVTGGNGPQYAFSVDDGPQQDINFPISVFSGDHLITVYDALNCTFDTTIILTQPNPITISLDDVITVELGDSATLRPIFNSGGTPINFDSIFWEPAVYLSCDRCPEPVVRPQESTNYTLTVFDENGCVGSAEIFVDVDKNRNVYLPNAFSPNGDGINDEFRVFTGAGVSRINYVRLFDRWGNLIYSQENLDPSESGVVTWDGYFKGKLMDPAVFVYLVEVTFQDGLVLLYRGDLTLFR